MAAGKLKRINKVCKTDGCNEIMYNCTNMRLYCPRCVRIRNNKSKRISKAGGESTIAPEDDEKRFTVRSGCDDIIDRYLGRHGQTYSQALAIAKGI